MKKLLVSLVAGCLLLTACGAASQKTVTVKGEGTAKNIVITAQAQKQEPVSMNVGDTCEIQIPTIPTAGYTWEPDNLDTTILSQMGEPVFKSDTGASSAGGIVILKFEAVGKGTTNLTLIYTNASTSDEPALYSKTFGVAIEVK
jgi:predicted secreted protein